MKTLFIGLTFLLASSFVKHPKQATTDVYYQVDYIGTTQVDANYEWVWKVTNPFPGSGKDGTTLQDLSHWSIDLGSCVTQADIVGAAYSMDGINWTSMSSTIAVDPSATCYGNAVMKFNFGLNDEVPTYYKLIVNRPFNGGYIPAVFKSGRYTGCYVSTVWGLTCAVEPPRE